MRLTPINEGLEIFYNPVGSNWKLGSAKGDLEGDGKSSFGSFIYDSSKNRFRSSISLSVNVDDNGSKRHVDLELGMSTPDDEYPLVFASASQNVSTEFIDVNYILEQVEDIVDSLYETISGLDFGSIIGAMIDRKHGFISEIQDSIGTELRIIISDLDKVR